MDIVKWHGKLCEGVHRSFRYGIEIKIPGFEESRDFLKFLFMSFFFFFYLVLEFMEKL